jgi:uncharacterized membrane protein
MSREATQSQRDWLEGEIATWQEMGLIDEDQARALLGLYESRESLEARRQSRGLLTLLALAATFVGLGVLLLVGYNWAEMPAPLKVMAIFGALIGTHAAGFGLRYQIGWRRLSEVVFFLGCLFYGAAIWLLAQIFNITSSNYDGLWWWAIGALPFALLLDTVLLHLLFAGLLGLWVGFEVLSLESLIWGMPNGGYSLPLLVAPGLWWAYRKNSAMTVGIYVPLLAWWVVLQPIAWKLEANPTFFIGAVGALMLLVAALHRPRSEMAIPYRFYGLALVGATLVPLSFHQFNESVANANNPGGFQMGRSVSVLRLGGVEQVLPISILVAGILILAFFLNWKSHGDVTRAQRSLAESLWEIVQRHIGPFVFLGLFAFLSVYVPAVKEAWVPTILANLAMVAVAFWLIRFGLTVDQGRPFGAGVAYLLLWAVLRYADLFGAFGGMLGASLMFFLCGGVLLGVALYWRNRKAVSLA